MLAVSKPPAQGASDSPPKRPVPLPPARKGLPSQAPSPAGTPAQRPAGTGPVIGQSRAGGAAAQSGTPQKPAEKASESTYTVNELNGLLKKLLEDHYSEVTTGCNSAKIQIEAGIKLINNLPDSDAVNLTKTGLGFISLIEKETKDALDWVQLFDITGRISKEDLEKKYKMNPPSLNGKFTVENIKSIFQKSQEKSLLVAQDCKVKHGQFQGWLNEYFVKHPVGQPKKADSKGGFLGLKIG